MNVSRAFRCEICDGQPLWRLDRRGDAVVSWSCAVDLSAVLERLQRDWEITQIVVRHSPKLREWSEITTALSEVGDV